MEVKKQSNQDASHKKHAVSEKAQTDAGREAQNTLAYAQTLRPLWATFRNILLVVFLIFICAIVQMLMLWRVCNIGMETASALQNQGLPTLNGLAALQEHIAIYRLNAYEYLFAQQGEKASKAKAVKDTAAQTREELENFKTHLPEGEGQRLASNLENAFADLDTEFRKVQNLVDSDFAGAMKLMDQSVPPLTERVTAAANAFSKYGYHFSEEQADATFDSFGWIKKNAVLFGAVNIVVVLGAVLFVQLAARRSRVQLSKTMERVEERTKELAESLSLLNATLESTADGIMVINQEGKTTSYNAKFAQMWQLPHETIESGKEGDMLKFVAGQLKDEEAFVRRVNELYAAPEMEGLDILEFKDGRVFERYSQPQRLGESVVGRVWCFRDVTERVRAEGAVHESQALYHSLVDQMPAGVYRKNTEGQFVFVNSSFCQLKNLESDQILGRTASEIALSQIQNPTSKWLPVIADQGKVHHEIILRTGETIMSEEQYSDLNDKKQFLRAVKSPVYDSNGNIVGTQGILFNITEYKMAEAALQQERNLLRTLIDHIPDYIYVRDRSNRFIVANESFARLMGVAEPSALMGKRDADFYPPSTAANFDHIDQGVFEGHPQFNRESVVLFPNRQELVTLNTKVPLKNAKGEVIGLIGIGRDITERKRVEAELDYERDLLRALLDNSPDQIYFKDTQSRFLKSSKAQADNFGVKDADDLIGKSDFDFFAEEHARPAFEDEQEIIRTGRPLVGKVEKEILTNGHERWVIASKMPFHDKDGRIIGTFGITKDITGIKVAEARLKEVHKQFLETSRRAGMAEIATNVLHNVGNVLNSVNVSASVVADNVRKSKVSSLAKVVGLLREKEDDLGTFFTSDPRGRQLTQFLSQLSEHFLEHQKTAVAELESLRANIDHIKEIVAMQQTYARVSGVTESINVKDLVEDSLRMNLGGLDRHGVDVIREFSDVPSINTDKHKVLQILVNLLRNAKHACQDSERADKCLTVRITNGSDMIKVSVIDNGVGIAPENMARIFNHGFTTRKDGHGFGLHSGALAAKELGGSLTVSSEGDGRGAIFTLELPIKMDKESNEHIA